MRDQISHPYKTTGEIAVFLQAYIKFYVFSYETEKHCGSIELAITSLSRFL
jgi:hypothetical protein